MRRLLLALAFVFAAVPAFAQESALAGFELRLQQLEAQIRQLTGQVEQQQFQIRTLQQQLEKSRQDLELRVGDIETRGGAAPVAPIASQPSPIIPLPAPSTAVNPGVVPPTQIIPSQTVPGAQRPAAVAPPPVGAPPAVTPGTAPATSPTVGVLGQTQPTPKPVTAEASYEQAYTQLTNGDPAGAEVSFKQFIAAHANDPRAPNAAYWLGETYYVRQQWQQAAVAFGDSYKKYPTGPKGADSLLKLGLSLGQLKQNSDACTALSQLDRQYPTASANVKRAATQERSRLKC
ncbi:tol-pal system protein YbgF [Roseiterribacter gracilis]|uniref:Cell division coordinator CpoB n=1 Tax=Roseiterribacter gracilis TaxID=2812848 RepID=A0A8S8XE61_9PROT|nr:tol-pal system protein YbgF [Rhodospirillales bacterium TMPK1]